ATDLNGFRRLLCGSIRNEKLANWQMKDNQRALSNFDWTVVAHVGRLGRTGPLAHAASHDGAIGCGSNGVKGRGPVSALSPATAVPADCSGIIVTLLLVTEDSVKRGVEATTTKTTMMIGLWRFFTANRWASIAESEGWMRGNGQAKCCQMSMEKQQMGGDGW
ncbi:MAG: hypothetical protein LQ341_006073, partial [Variospora aurantia]